MTKFEAHKKAIRLAKMWTGATRNTHSIGGSLLYAGETYRIEYNAISNEWISWYLSHSGKIIGNDQEFIEWAMEGLVGVNSKSLLHDPDYDYAPEGTAGHEGDEYLVGKTWCICGRAAMVTLYTYSHDGSAHTIGEEMLRELGCIWRRKKTK